MFTFLQKQWNLTKRGYVVNRSEVTLVLVLAATALQKLVDTFVAVVHPLQQRGQQPFVQLISLRDFANNRLRLLRPSWTPVAWRLLALTFVTVGWLFRHFTDLLFSLFVQLRWINDCKWATEQDIIHTPRQLYIFVCFTRLLFSPCLFQDVRCACIPFAMGLGSFKFSLVFVLVRDLIYKAHALVLSMSKQPVGFWCGSREVFEKQTFDLFLKFKFSFGFAINFEVYF